MLFWEYCFVISCVCIFYNYLGYALIAYAINLIKKKKSNFKQDFFPSVSFIVAAYNEQDCIEQKIKNSLSQNYPEDLMEFIFVTDGSTDNTPQIIQQYSSIKLLHKTERRGKSAALNRAVNTASNEILIFSDANALLNTDATKNIVRHYEREKIGGVAGGKKVIAPDNSGEMEEGVYWKYESTLKKIDSDFYSVVGAAGELFSVRRKLYQALPEDIILDDFVCSMRVAEKNYRIIYEPKAYAAELPSFSLMDEQKRKIRIAAGGFQAMVLLKSLFAFWKNPRLSFLYISHRVLRWTLSPLCIIMVFISNFFLFLNSDTLFFKILFPLQVSLYTLAILSNSVKNPRLKILKFTYYFLFMNLSVIQGFFRFLRRKQPVTWEKAKRAKSVVHIE